MGPINFVRTVGLKFLARGVRRHLIEMRFGLFPWYGWKFCSSSFGVCFFEPACEASPFQVR